MLERLELDESATDLGQTLTPGAQVLRLARAGEKRHEEERRQRGTEGDGPERPDIVCERWRIDACSLIDEEQGQRDHEQQEHELVGQERSSDPGATQRDITSSVRAEHQLQALEPEQQEAHGERDRPHSPLRVPFPTPFEHPAGVEQCDPGAQDAGGGAEVTTREGVRGEGVEDQEPAEGEAIRMVPRQLRQRERTEQRDPGFAARRHELSEGCAEGPVLAPAVQAPAAQHLRPEMPGLEQVRGMIVAERDLAARALREPECRGEREQERARARRDPRGQPALEPGPHAHRSARCWRVALRNSSALSRGDLCMVEGRAERTSRACAEAICTKRCRQSNP
jgi:hypothetical protein